MEEVKETRPVTELEQALDGLAPWPDGVRISEDGHSLTFRLQEGPIGKVGVNGCQIDEMVSCARTIIEFFNKAHPCRENSLVITKLQEAEHWLLARTRDRTSRGIEGTNSS